jgi:hypothetical protein
MNNHRDEEQLELPGIPPSEACIRRNLFLPDKQYRNMQKLSRHIGCSTAELYRQAADEFLAKKVAELKAKRG